MSAAVAYVRVSTNEQAESGLGLEAQRQRLALYAEMAGLEVTETIADNGVSAGKYALAERPGGQRLLAALASKQGPTAVLILKLDRAFRSTIDCLATVEQWDKRGIGLHILDLCGLSIDTKTAAGKFMLTVMAALAEMERNQTRERTAAALHVKRQRRERIGQHVPYGWRLRPVRPSDSDRTTKRGQPIRRLEEDPEQQRMLRFIWSLHLQGHTANRIADSLTHLAVPTPSNGTRWRHKTVDRILRRLEDVYRAEKE